MKAVIQRVSEASVTIENEVKGKINLGLMILLGVTEEDSQEDADWLIGKVRNMRIFNDQEGKMNLSIQDVNGAFLVISQFTLYASTKKGNRPSFIKAAKPNVAIPLYEYFVNQLLQTTQLKVETGEFGADMKVNLTNDGPVTILIDSKNKE